jgi:hypothetical protein
LVYETSRTPGLPLSPYSPTLRQSRRSAISARFSADTTASPIDRHGTGPYPADELAGITGITAEDARRVLEQMAAEGLATR